MIHLNSAIFAQHVLRLEIWIIELVILRWLSMALQLLQQKKLSGKFAASQGVEVCGVYAVKAYRSAFREGVFIRLQVVGFSAQLAQTWIKPGISG